MDIYTKIRKQLQNVCQPDRTAIGLHLAEVVSVEQDTTCTVRLTPSLTLSGVQLRAVVNTNTSGIVLTPAVGSYVLVADLSGGQYTRMAAVMYSETDSIAFNGGQHGGLVNIEDLTGKLNNLVNEVNALKDTFNNHTHVLSGTCSTGPISGTATPTASKAQAASKFDKSDYEDDKVKH